MVAFGLGHGGPVSSGPQGGGAPVGRATLGSPPMKPVPGRALGSEPARLGTLPRLAGGEPVWFVGDVADGPYQPEWELSAALVDYYRRMLRTHTNAPDTGVCRVCKIRTCPDFRDAYDRLAAAGALMGDASQW